MWNKDNDIIIYYGKHEKFMPMSYVIFLLILWNNVQDAFFSSTWHEFDESRNQMMKKNSDFWVSATVLYRVETNIFVVPFRELSLLAKIMQKRKIFCFYAKIESGNFDFKPSAVSLARVASLSSRFRFRICSYKPLA